MHAARDPPISCKQDCTLPLDSRYQVSPAVDAAEAFNSLGRNAACGNYTACPPGSYPNASGTRTSDRTCAPCPPGSHGTDGERCVPCTAGETYSPSHGSTSCLECSRCDEGNGTAQVEPGWGGCAANRSCPVAYRSLCSLAADASCMRCPQPGWRLSVETRLCEACELGYLLHAHHSSPGARGECDACPEDHYCPGPGTRRPCQGLRAFEGPPGVLHSVPRSPEGSVFASDCSCASSGGGFEGHADGLVGCTPCRDGFFEPPGDGTSEPRCKPCPVGSYASR